ncbi:hypothetical protein [Eoetvoesiella caeni]|uniref:Uncharacterized protein n=1 Tax=Eoetvoesiella caeni TaxID=645616 RepID=A0A366HAL0_9BURK|nr:hypothetical protein [Eoetvoesiella caeni]MCI2809340.1 hypothetical protein [Eoetvoesiella caeni]NYT54481.1 hypothetical protein [Eoetvoesiella caeni]RBP39331.1 hypothetical protein DFR37_105124 [Eoetvoesiella caeni]
MSFDILQDFSKTEILQWVRENAFARVRKSDLLFIRWKLAAKTIEHDHRQEMDHWAANKPDFSRRDGLARQFNESINPQEKLRLLRQMRPYDLALQQHIERCKKLDKRQKHVDGLYRKYEEEQGNDNH